MTKAIDRTQHCQSMAEVRQHIDALDDVLVPLLVERSGYMLQAARLKQHAGEVRDEARIQAIVDRVRAKAEAEGGSADVLEQIYRDMMEAFIAYEAGAFAAMHPNVKKGEAA